MRGKKMHRMFVAAVLLLVTSLLSSTAPAAVINYGNFGPVAPGVTFLDVTESSATDAVPLYGPPEPYSVGLDFDPKGFVATASGGSADITDGQLNFIIAGDISPPPGVAIESISLYEAGDYTLAGFGTTATQALAGAIIRVTVTQIDGVDVAPIVLAPSNASVGFNLVANGGVAEPWELETSVDIGQQLTNMDVPFVLGATKVEVAINNTLVALSESSSLSFIAKKEFIIDVETRIPEPATGFLLALGACALGLRRRRAL